MAYFDKYIKDLYKTSMDILKQEEVGKFLNLFENANLLETVPRQFMLLIDFATYLLNKIENLLNADKTKKETRKQKDEKQRKKKTGEDLDHEIDVTYASNDFNNLTKIKRGDALKRKSGRIRSSLNDIPLQRTSEFFTYFSMNVAIFAHKFGNKLLLNSAGIHIEACKIVEAIVDMSTIKESQDNAPVEIKRKMIASKIDCLRVTGRDTTHEIFFALQSPSN